MQSLQINAMQINNQYRGMLGVGLGSIKMFTLEINNMFSEGYCLVRSDNYSYLLKLQKKKRNYVQRL